MIALLCSVQAEAEHLLASLSVTRTLTAGSKSLVDGTLGGQRVMLSVGGMGKVNAAHAATLLCAYEPKAIIVFGIGGAYPSSGADVGDIALAKEEIAGDEGVLTADGFKDAQYIGIPLLKTQSSVIYSTYPAPDLLTKQALQLLRADRNGAAVQAGSFVTLSTCTGTAARARELEARYHGLCENMEGAAVAQVATLHAVPWLEVRGISNIVEDRNLAAWNIPAASRAAQQAVVRILEGWKQ